MVNMENPCHKKLVKDLTGLMKNKVRADNLMLELEYRTVQDDFQAKDIMKLLFIRGITFSNKRSEENFATNCSQWVYTV